MLPAVRVLLDLLAYGGVLLAEGMVRSLPAPTALRLGDRAGDLWRRLDGRRRDRAREGLRVARRGGLALADPEAVMAATYAEPR